VAVGADDFVHGVCVSCCSLDRRKQKCVALLSLRHGSLKCFHMKRVVNPDGVN
jgi:hypothetical protein